MLENNGLENKKRDKEKNFFTFVPGGEFRDKISNPLLQTLDALSALNRLVTGIFILALATPSLKEFDPVPTGFDGKRSEILLNNQTGREKRPFPPPLSGCI
jgi:hypothetical protein